MNEVIVTKENFATMLNLGKISKESLDAFNKECNNYSKEISEIIIREQQKQAVIDQVETTTEIMGVGSDIGKALINKTVNEGLTQSVSFKFSDDSVAFENKERVGEFWKEEKQKDSAEFLREEIQTVVRENEKVLRDHNVFTEEEFNKILHAKENDLPEMFDYSLSGGKFKDMQDDINIIHKCSSCTLKDKNSQYIFKNFLIIDGSGTAVDSKLINKSTKRYLLNFGLQSDVGKKNIKAFQILNAKVEVLDKARKISKLRGNANILKLLKKIGGIDELKKEFREYTSQLRPIKQGKKIVTTAAKVTEKGVKVGYKGFRFLSLSPLRKDYADAKKTKDVKKALAQYKKLKAKKEAFSKFEKGASAVRHPVRTISSRITERIKSSRIVSEIREKVKKSSLNRFKESLSNVLSMPFKIVGKAVAPIAVIIRAIVVKIMILMAPILIFLLLFVVLGLAASGSVSTIPTLISTVPFANPEDFDAYQKQYDTLDDNFLMSLENYLGDYATQQNLKGEKIKYGINGQNNESGMENNDYQNGMYYKFITDDEHAGRSSNIEDVIATMAIMMTQSQSDHRDVALKIIEWLYDISHSYTFNESPLYACDSACHNIHYECNDHFHEYSDTDIRFNPFHARRKSGDDYEIREATDYCVVCNETFNGANNTNCIVAQTENPTKEDYYGCVGEPNKCYHGIDGNMGRSIGTCDNFSPIYMCPGHEYHTATTAGVKYCSGPLGCQGYYECEGHTHYHCPGHEYKCCMGHTDIQMNVQIKFFAEFKDIINNYDFGENDIYYQEVVSKRKEE